MSTNLKGHVMQQSIRPNRFLRLPDVIKFTGLSRSNIYKLIQEAKFPKPVSISERCVAWIERDVEEWIEEKINDQQAGMNKS